jgi:hypothetical protein
VVQGTRATLSDEDECGTAFVRQPSEACEKRPHRTPEQAPAYPLNAVIVASGVDPATWRRASPPSSLNRSWPSALFAHRQEIARFVPPQTGVEGPEAESLDERVTRLYVRGAVEVVHAREDLEGVARGQVIPEL